MKLFQYIKCDSPLSLFLFCKVLHFFFKALVTVFIGLLFLWLIRRLILSYKSPSILGVALNQPNKLAVSTIPIESWERVLKNDH